MGIMRKTLMERLRNMFPNIEIKETMGYITKYWRERKNIKKSHTSDAFVIAKNLDAKRLDKHLLIVPKRQHNRQIHKCTINKDGIRKLNQTPKYVFGYKLFDKVLCLGQEGFIFGRRSSGYFDIRKLNGEKIHAGISYKKIKLLERSNSMLIAY